MTPVFVDRIVRPGERKTITGLSDVHTRRLEDADAHPQRFKLCPDSGKYGATGHMLSSLLAWTEWRAAGGPGSWAEWEAAHRTTVVAVLAVASVAVLSIFSAPWA